MARKVFIYVVSCYVDMYPKPVCMSTLCRPFIAQSIREHTFVYIYFVYVCSERFARSAGLLDRPGRYAISTVEYIGLADSLENHSTPPYSPQDSNWRDATSFSSCPAHSELRRAVLNTFDGLVLYSSLAVASPPYNAVDSDIQPYQLWTKSSDVSQPSRASPNLLLCLESKRSWCVPHASKPAGPIY